MYLLVISIRQSRIAGFRSNNHITRNKSTKLMRNDMLFIDGKLVDLDDNTKITLNFKSNILQT